MSPKNLTPTRLRIVLSIALLLLACIGTAVFIYGFYHVKARATRAQTIAADAEASRSSVQNLTTQKDYLEKNSAIVNRANQLAAKSQLYEYQDQIINDLNAYAKASGVTVTGITFQDSNAKTTPTVTTPGAKPSVAPNGITSTVAAVTIANPVAYDNVLKFIDLIQQSLFRIQVDKVSISTSPDASNPSLVATDAFTIEAYVKK